MPGVQLTHIITVLIAFLLLGWLKSAVSGGQLREGYYPWWRRRLPWWRRRWGQQWWYDPYYARPYYWKYNYQPYYSYY